MFYMQQRLVESIHEDRHSEAQAARLSGPERLPGSSRSVVVSSLVVNFARRTRAALRGTAI
jgi:hypothetical protein